MAETSRSTHRTAMEIEADSRAAQHEAVGSAHLCVIAENKRAAIWICIGDGCNFSALIHKDGYK